MKLRAFAIGLLLGVVGFMFLWAARVEAGTCTTEALRTAELQFRPGAGEELAHVTGFTVHVGTTSGQYQRHEDAGPPLGTEPMVVQIPGLDTGARLYFAVSAYGPAGESPLSNEISLAASRCLPPSAPVLERVTMLMEDAAAMLTEAARLLRGETDGMKVREVRP